MTIILVITITGLDLFKAVQYRNELIETKEIVRE